MANITTRRTGELQRAILQILAQHPEGVPAKDVLARLSEQLSPTDFEKSDYPNSPGVRRFEKIARFSSIPLVKAGWLVKAGGVWTITDEGRIALRTIPDPKDFRKAAVKKYREWAAARGETDIPEDPELEDGGTSIANLEEAEENAWADIHDHLAKMPPYDLQTLVAALLRAMGYHVSFNAPSGPDQGIDVIAHTDPLGISDPRIKVQVKRHADKINVDGIRSFLSLVNESDAGIYVATGGFTSEAERTARGQERRKIMLIDARRLVELWIEHYEKVPDDHRRLMPLKPIYYLDLDS